MEPSRPTSVNLASKRMEEFQSLGGNCEFGFVQRYSGCETSGLLRFSYVPIEALIHAISTDFREYAVPGDLYLDVTVDHAYYCVSRRYGIWSSQAVFVGEEDPGELLARCYARTAHLKAKMLKDLASGETIFVRKLLPGETREQFDRLVQAIRRHGPATVVLVSEDSDGGDDWVPKPARWLGPGVVEGSVRRFSSLDRAWDVDFEPWTWLVGAVYALHRGVDVAALYPGPPPAAAPFSPKLRLHRHQVRDNGISSFVRSVPPRGFDPRTFYLFQTWVWIPDTFTGSRVFAVAGQEILHGTDADLDRRECWQRVWRVGRFQEGDGTAAAVGLSMLARANDRIWSHGARFYEGMFPRWLPKPAFRPSRLRLLANA